MHADGANKEELRIIVYKCEYTMNISIFIIHE